MYFQFSFELGFFDGGSQLDFELPSREFKDLFILFLQDCRQIRWGGGCCLISSIHSTYMVEVQEEMANRLVGGENSLNVYLRSRVRCNEPWGKEGLWIRRFLNELMPKDAFRVIDLLGDNETTLTKDPESQNRTKHVDVMHHHVRGLVHRRRRVDGGMDSKCINALPAVRFERLGIFHFGLVILSESVLH